jgi:acyl carrier protein
MYGNEIADVLRHVQSILSYQLCVPLDVVAASATLEEDLQMDRLDFAEACIALEEAFDVEIDEMREFQTVLDLAAYVSRRVLRSTYAHTH